MNYNKMRINHAEVSDIDKETQSKVVRSLNM